VVWRSNDVIKLPDDIPQRYGHLTELVGTGLHSVDRAGISQGDSVLILGAGGGGLILLQLALMAGASKVVVMEPVESKRRIAQEMGATLVVDPHRTEDMGKVSQMTKYSGYNCVIDASGDINMVPRGFNLLARGGTLLIYSKYGENCTFNMYELYIKEATIKASYMAPFILSRSVNIMPRLNLEPIVTAEYPICAAQQAFDAHMTGMHPRIRICIPD